MSWRLTWLYLPVYVELTEARGGEEGVCLHLQEDTILLGVAGTACHCNARLQELLEETLGRRGVCVCVWGGGGKLVIPSLHYQFQTQLVFQLFWGKKSCQWKLGMGLGGYKETDGYSIKPAKHSYVLTWLTHLRAWGQPPARAGPAVALRPSHCTCSEAAASSSEAGTPCCHAHHPHGNCCHGPWSYLERLAKVLWSIISIV